MRLWARGWYQGMCVWGGKAWKITRVVDLEVSSARHYRGMAIGA